QSREVNTADLTFLTSFPSNSRSCMKTALAITALILFAVVDLSAQPRQEFRIPRAPEPPKIDGVLDDAAWTQAPLPLGEWVSYNPLRGDKMAPELRTDVR